MKDLPKRTYYKHGSFWYVQNGKWTNLGKDKESAIRKATKYNGSAIPGQNIDQLENSLKNSFLSRMRDAKKSGITFSIKLDEITEVAAANQWRCQVTGIPFSLTKPDASKRRPYSPSIDRINPADGYTKDNTRIVCLAVNLAMNEWGDEVVSQISQAWFFKMFRAGILDNRLR